METPKKTDSRVVMTGIAAVVLSVAAMLMMQPALAQTNSTETDNRTGIPELNGSVNLEESMNEFVRDSIQVSFTDAAATAQSQVENGVVIGGQLTSVQGYLAYTFMVANYDAGTSHMVIVDAGNGEVLYTSDEMPLHNGGLGRFGPRGGGHAFGGFGPGSWMGKGTTSESSESSDVETTSA